MAANKTLSSVGEFGLIDQFKKILYAGKAVVSIGDDTAVLPFTKTKYQLLTTDMIVEGVHFTSSTLPRLIGQKVMNCNISDIAAMGGVPKFAVISLGTPSNKSLKYIQDIYQGINAAAKKFDVGVVGGDTVKNSKLVINIALLGEVLKKNLVLRSTAKPGDQIFVTGPLGGSLKSGRHLTFTPRVKESQYLVKNYTPTAMMDISDGLIADLGHIINSSQVGALIEENKIPRHKNVTIKQALSDGEDFELLFTLPEKQAEQLVRTKHPGMKFYLIGEVTSGGFKLLTKDLSLVNIISKGYQHF
ncbi:MAG: thiamine-monophosphate kinase [Candidatus Omnitrophica bacterium]|nr:thiamine-monophosphate kinase [Candidatus Omnitrophota bacterium]